MSAVHEICHRFGPSATVTSRRTYHRKRTQRAQTGGSERLTAKPEIEDRWTKNHERLLGPTISAAEPIDCSHCREWPIRS